MVYNVPIDFFRNGIEFHTFCFIDSIKQSWKRIAKAETTPTPVANVEYALHFLQKRRFVVEGIAFPIQRMPGWRVQAAFAIVLRLAYESKHRTEFD